MSLVSFAKIVLRGPEGKYLILRSSEWPDNPSRSLQPDLPGGVIEDGETPEQGLLRELLEETGLRLEEKDLTLVYEALKEYETKTFHRHIYFAITDEADITLSWEHDKYWWLSADEVLNLNIRDPYPDVFKKMHKAGLIV